MQGWTAPPRLVPRHPSKDGIFRANGPSPGSAPQLCFRRSEGFSKVTALVHFEHDVAAADEFTPDVQLGNGRPVGERFDALADAFVLEYVDGGEGSSAGLEDLNRTLGKSALGCLGGALHEQNDVVTTYKRFNFFFDGHGVNFRFVLAA